MTEQRRFVQLRNPVSDRWVKIDTETGRIVETKQTAGPWEGVPIFQSTSAPPIGPLVAQGMSAIEIARTLGISRARVYQIAKREGVDWRKRT